jgi:uncharacterized coiled-coil DUF342 family protein
MAERYESQRQIELLHQVMAERLPHWMDMEEGIPLTDAATFIAIDDIARRLEREREALRAQLASALEQIDALTEAKRSTEDLLCEVRAAWRSTFSDVMGQRDKARSALDDAAIELMGLRAELRAAVTALRQIQWSNPLGNEDFMACPLCDQIEARGHAPDCHVGAAIENYDAKHPDGK